MEPVSYEQALAVAKEVGLGVEILDPWDATEEQPTSDPHE